MKKKLREQFLPFNYNQALYEGLHNLKQEGRVGEYMEAFHQLVVRVDLDGSEEEMGARYLSGLEHPSKMSLAFNHCGMCRKPTTRLYWWRNNKLGLL